MKWIRTAEENPAFSEFTDSFRYGGGQALLRISADYQYACYLNGQFAANGQYADFPAQKAVDTVDITPFLREGENTLRVLLMHTDRDYSTARTMPPALAFEISAAGKLLLASSEKTLSRPAAGYRAGDVISNQLGRGLHFSFTAEPAPFTESRSAEVDFHEVPRPTKKTTLLDTPASEIVAQGIFQKRGGDTAADVMQRAYLSSSLFAAMTGKDRVAFASRLPLTFRAGEGDGIYLIADLGQESAGYPYFTVTVPEDTVCYFGWGEHLADLRVRTSIEGRHFGQRIELKAGENGYEDYLRRLGARYFCLFVEAHEVTLGKIGIRREYYPFAMPEKDFGDRLFNRIYETGRETLRLCAHAHYEDCPWREQALYGMDSRNQMLFGYGAFGEYDFPRANLSLIAACQREDGLIPLCPPSRGNFTIPSFTAHWLLAIYENYRADRNDAFLTDILPHAERAVAFFRAQEKDGILHTFSAPAYWNFHEWSEGLDGGQIVRDYDVPEEGDAILTALVSRAVRGIGEIEAALGRAGVAADYAAFSATLAAGAEIFWDEEKSLYASYLTDGKRRGYHAYTQAMLATAVPMPEERFARLAEVLKHPEGVVVPLTPAALPIAYEALLRDPAELNWVLDDICRLFGGMLFRGATSFWETQNGEADFTDAGSLCHGWSAVPCYIFDTYLTDKKH